MSDVIRVQCQSCLATIKAKPKHQGKRIRCPGCGEALQIPAAPDVLEPILSPVTVPPFPAAAPVFADEATILDDSAYETDDQFVLDEPRYDEYDEYGAPAPRTRRAASAKRSPSPVDRRDGLIAVVCGILMILGAGAWIAFMFVGGFFDFYPFVLFVVGIIVVIKGLAGD